MVHVGYWRSDSPWYMVPRLRMGPKNRGQALYNDPHGPDNHLLALAACEALITCFSLTLSLGVTHVT